MKSSQSMMAFPVSKKFYEQVRIVAALRGISMSEFIRNAVKKELMANLDEIQVTGKFIKELE